MSIRTPCLRLLAFAGALALAGCAGSQGNSTKSVGALNVLDEAGLADIMLNFADPNEAARYFQKSLAEEPDRIDFKRGLAQSLMRGQKSQEAALVYRQMIEQGQAAPIDRLGYADALIRNAAWNEAEEQLDAIPPTLATYDRYRLEAMVADYNKQWKKSDSFYETARGLTTQPAPIYNNWGISKMSRGDYRGAEEMFRQAVTFNSKLFNAKNNMVIARAKRKTYTLPVVPMSEEERAQLLHNMALQAIRNGDLQTGRGLLEEAVDTHPQHFEAAVEKLDALGKKITR